MKAIMVMFDSLNLRSLSTYGNEWINTPNFDRLAKQTVQFENHYVASMPCMPARRELHTGRYNFLHRSWGPIEPYDESIFETMKNNSIYSHLITDHQHYWEDGGCTYHTRYSSFELFRGQEGDPWKAVLGEKPNKSEFESGLDKDPVMHRMHVHDAINRQYLDSFEKMPQTRVFDSGIEFLEKNHDKDNWFLQIETFDPHEPFFAANEFEEMYGIANEEIKSDWPPYDFVKQEDSVVNRTWKHYAALLTQCDRNLGKVLDFMDAHDLWKDTLLIVNTDHGYLLGEHGWWGKTVMPMYNEIAHIPLYIYDPRTKISNEKRFSLTQSVDVAATLVDYFNLTSMKHVQGKSLLPVVKSDEKIRDYALFGEHGKYVNVTDGDYLYMRAPKTIDNGPLYEYVLMPTHMRSRYSVTELRNAKMVKDQFKFMEGVPCLQVPVVNPTNSFFNYGTKLFDIKKDPNQEQQLDNEEKELELINALVNEMRESEAPVEQYERLGLPVEGKMTLEELHEEKEFLKEYTRPLVLENYSWTEGGKNVYRAYLKLMNPSNSEISKFSEMLEENIQDENSLIDEKVVLNCALTASPEEQKVMVDYFLSMAARTI